MVRSVRIVWNGSRLAGKASRSKLCNIPIESFPANKTIQDQNFNNYLLSRISPDNWDSTDQHSIIVRFGLIDSKTIVVYSASTLVTEMAPVMAVLRRVGMEIAAISYLSGNFVSNLIIVSDTSMKSCQCRKLRRTSDRRICAYCMRDIIPVAATVLERGGVQALRSAMPRMNGKCEKNLIGILCQFDRAITFDTRDHEHWRVVLEFGSSVQNLHHSTFCTVKGYCPGNHSGILPILSALIDQYSNRDDGEVILNQIRRLLTMSPLIMEDIQC